MSGGPGAKARVEIELRLASHEEAQAVADALSVDDGTYVETKVVGSTVVAKAEAEDPKSLMHTLDDYLSCANVAIRAAAQRRPSPPP